MKRHNRSLTIVLVTMSTLVLGVAGWAGLPQEVVESSGNQTLSSSFFSTAP